MTDMIGYAVIVEQADDGGYGAWSPDLPGCVGLGDTIEECLADMKEAISLYVDVLRECGDEVPQARAIQAVTLPAA